MDVLFISDLHLAEERPQTTAAFLAFLGGDAARASQLYILGDLFDAWIGDDDDRPLAATIAEALAALSGKGVQIYFQHGNRDFLLGKAYAEGCGMHLLPPLAVVELGGITCLLAHGDQFCTGDVAYQQFRAQVRDPAWQQQFLSRPLAERRTIAADLRSRSREANSMKPEDIMDVTPSEIVTALAQSGARLLVHGHTHRPARHVLELAGAPAERYVLGEWAESAWVARWQGEKALSLVRLDLQQG